MVSIAERAINKKLHEILRVSRSLCSFQLEDRTQHLKCASFVKSEDKNARLEASSFHAPREKEKAKSNHLAAAPQRESEKRLKNKRTAALS